MNSIEVGIRRLYYVFVFVTICLLLLIHNVHGSDWPMWRYDANRSAASPSGLPSELHLLWERQFIQRIMVWDDPLNQDIMSYDRIFEPIVVGKNLYIGFNDCDKVMALDTENGEEKWSFYADGPVRLPPCAWNGRIFFTSDDGFLYCINALSGELEWKFRGGPSERRVLGNKRLISMWPARGGAVVKDNKVYFAASIWPFMGTFIYSLDAKTGDVVWMNDGTGADYILQPHNSPAFAGVAPQGALVVSDDNLLIPGGRSVPACFDLSNGNLLYYELHENGKTGGSFVCALKDLFFNYHRERVVNMFDISDGDKIGDRVGGYPVLTDRIVYFSGNVVSAFDYEKIQKNPEKPNESKLWEIDVDASNDLIKVGERLYAAGSDGITAIDLNGVKGEPKVLWKKDVNGQVERILAADDKLFAVTLDGRIMAFGAKKTSVLKNRNSRVVMRISDEIDLKVRTIIQQTGVKEGYALLYGITSGDFLEALLRHSDLHIIAVDADSAKVDKFRRRFCESGSYGKRISIHQGDPFTFDVPPYIASLTFINEVSTDGYGFCEKLLKKVFYSMRPYGGKLCLNVEAEYRDLFVKKVKDIDLYGLTVVSDDELLILSREGALAGSDDWTHQYGNIANTTKSDDTLVKLPLGVLWFGGNSNLDVLPRHGHGPPEQVVGGRLFIEGINCISARDVYTGRVLWKVEMECLGNYGVFYDDTYTDTPTKVTYNQIHIPGANVRGTNFVATDDRLYVVQGGECHMLDAATGETIKVFSLPPSNNGKKPQWGYVGVYKDYLIGGYGFVKYSVLVEKSNVWEIFLSKLSKNKIVFTNYDKSASSGLIVMNRYTGDILWSHDARYGFIHNAVAVGNDKIFCLDKIPPFIEEKLHRRGISFPDTYSMKAIDIQTGKTLWEEKENIFGTWLSYSEEYDILIQARRPSRDMVRGEEGKQISAFRGSDGTLLWDKEDKYLTFPIIHNDKIITEEKAFSLLKGEILYRTSPFTGKKIPWTWKRQYGCNYPIASESLVTFRSAASGYYDIVNYSGIGNFGGFRSGCTSNLIAANGVLNAPDYTRTCQCSYQNQTSLALVHIPDVEMWTYNNIELDDAPIKRIGINFGAPGDRLADNGTLWLDYPIVGGPSPNVSVSVIPEEVEWFRYHSSRVKGEGLKWVAASGCKGLRSVKIGLANKSRSKSPYTVRLYFNEPDKIKTGERVFDILIQGECVLKEFDIIYESKMPNRVVVKKFRDVKVKNILSIELISSVGFKESVPIVCGIEVISEEW